MAPQEPRETLSARLLNWLGLESLRQDDTRSTVVLADPERVSTTRLPRTLRDRYRINQVLGHGSFGIVYLARDLSIGRLIAIKQLYSYYRGKDAIRQRFLQEARIAGQLDNPNVVTIYDVADDGDSACIIMEYLAGGHLGTVIDQEGPLSPETALIYMKGILNGMAIVHSMGVVHRDVKPRNILFDQSGTPKISDFGVAHLPMEAGGVDTPDDALSIVGTPEYMAPEQLDTTQPVDARTDIFAAGLLFYEMLTSEPAFDFTGIEDIREQAEIVRNADLPSTMSFLPEIPDSITGIIRRMVQTAPRDRYPDARSVLEDLNAALRNASAARRLTANLPSHPEYREMYADILRLFLVDGVISPPERRELTKRCERLGLSPSLARSIEEQVRAEMGLPLLQHLEAFRKRAEKLLRDREFSEADQANLEKLGEQYSISVSERQKIEREVMSKYHMR